MSSPDLKLGRDLVYCHGGGVNDEGSDAPQGVYLEREKVCGECKIPQCSHLFRDVPAGAELAWGPPGRETKAIVIDIPLRLLPLGPEINGAIRVKIDLSRHPGEKLPDDVLYWAQPSPDNGGNGQR